MVLKRHGHHGAPHLATVRALAEPVPEPAIFLRRPAGAGR